MTRKILQVGWICIDLWIFFYIFFIKTLFSQRDFSKMWKSASLRERRIEFVVQVKSFNFCHLCLDLKSMEQFDCQLLYWVFKSNHIQSIILIFERIIRDHAINKRQNFYALKSVSVVPQNWADWSDWSIAFFPPAPTALIGR